MPIQKYSVFCFIVMPLYFLLYLKHHYVEEEIFVTVNEKEKKKGRRIMNERLQCCNDTLEDLVTRGANENSINSNRAYIINQNLAWNSLMN